VIQKTYKFFNQSTRQAIFERVAGYVAKSYTKGDEIAAMIRKHKLTQYYRFDLGENVIGFSPKVYQFLLRLRNLPQHETQLNNYPEVLHERLRKRIAGRHHIDPNWVVISTGLEAILDLITRVFFEPKDYYISLIPSFFLFEEYSERMGATPVFVELSEEDNFAFTREKVSELKEQIIKFKPKIVWIANPNNPTGSVIDTVIIEDIIKLAADHNSFVVIDEAFVEFLDNIGSKSVIQFAGKYSNLIILRTFSKAYGLAAMRIGYLTSSSEDIINAIMMLRTNFPVTQLGLNMAGIALYDKQFLIETREKTISYAKKLLSNLNKLETFKYVPTSTNVFLLKNIYLTDKELDNEFKKKGIITSYISFPLKDVNSFLRITVRCEKDNDYFYKVCEEINEKYVNLFQHQLH